MDLQTKKKKRMEPTRWYRTRRVCFWISEYVINMTLLDKISLGLISLRIKEVVVA